MHRKGVLEHLIFKEKPCCSHLVVNANQLLVLKPVSYHIDTYKIQHSWQLKAFQLWHPILYKYVLSTHHNYSQALCIAHELVLVHWVQFLLKWNKSPQLPFTRRECICFPEVSQNQPGPYGVFVHVSGLAQNHASYSVPKIPDWLMRTDGSVLFVTRVAVCFPRSSIWFIEMLATTYTALLTRHCQ